MCIRDRHVAAGHLVHGREMGEAGRSDLDSIGFVGAVGNQVDSIFALGMLGGHINLALGHAVAFCEQLEMMDQGFHVLFHLRAGRRRDLVAVSYTHLDVYKRQAWSWGVSLANVRQGGSRQRQASPSPDYPI